MPCGGADPPQDFASQGRQLPPRLSPRAVGKPELGVHDAQLPTWKKKVISPQSVKTRCPHSAIFYVDQRCIFPVVKPSLKENIST